MYVDARASNGVFGVVGDLVVDRVVGVEHRVDV